MSEFLFSYGTLQNEEVQMELFGRILYGSADVLKGHKAVTIEIKDEPFLKEEDKYQLIAVISEDRDSIKGTVFEVTEEELFMADKYEPNNYKRVTVALKSGKQAWVYVAAETI